MNSRPSIPCPSPHDVDLAPQLLVVALADAALLAVDRALDCAHPVLAAPQRSMDRRARDREAGDRGASGDRRSRP